MVRDPWGWPAGLHHVSSLYTHEEQWLLHYIHVLHQGVAEVGTFGRYKDPRRNILLFCLNGWLLRTQAMRRSGLVLHWNMSIICFPVVGDRVLWRWIRKTETLHELT